MARLGIYAAPPIYLAGAASVAGIAIINSVGNLAGFVSPSIVGWIKDSTGSANAGLYVIGACLTAAALALLALRTRLTRTGA